MKIDKLFIVLCTATTLLWTDTVIAQVLQDTQPDGVSVPASGKLWSLDDCINYAIEHNITVQKRALEIENREVDLSTSKYSRLPNLNASIGADAGFRTKTVIAGAESSTISYGGNTRTGSLGVSSGVTVFDGFRINREIKGGKLDLAAAIQDLARAREDLSINIMTLYLEVLFAQEKVGIAERQLEYSTQQVTRSRDQVAFGKEPESTRYESEALQANDQLTLTEARNNLQIALLNLSQALNRESAAGFDIVAPELDSPTLTSLYNLGTANDIYAYAADNRPHIKAEQLRLESSENSVKLAKSAYYPSISLTGGYNTGVANGTIDEFGKTMSFGTQLRKNSREYIGLSMNIPIFNRLSTRNKVSRARIAVRDQRLTLNNAELELRKEIEQAWYTADAAYSKYQSAEVALSSAKIAFTYAEEKADAGRSTIYDFNDAKTRMEKAESDLVQAKYEFVFRSKILDFYRGRPLKL